MIMANEIKVLELNKYSKGTLRQILDALERISPMELGLKDLYQSTKNEWSIPEIGLSNKNMTNVEFENLVRNATRERSIRRSYAIIYELYQAKKDDAINSTLPDEEARELQELERQKRKAEKKEAEERSKTNVERSIKTKKELYIKQNEEARIREALAGKRIIVTPKNSFTKVTLTPQEKVKIHDLAQAIRIDPGTAQKIIEQKIQESINKSSENVKQSVTKPLITKTTLDLIEKVKPFGEYSKPEEIPDNIPTLNPISPLVVITNPDNPRLKELIPDVEVRNSLAQNTKYLSFAIDSERSLNSALTAPLFENSKNISTLFYPQQISEFQIAEDQENQESRDEGAEISLEDIYNQGKDVWNVWQKIANRTITADEVTTTLVSTLPSYTPSTTASIVSSSATFVTTALPATIGAVTGFGLGSLAGLTTKGVPLLGMGSSQIAGLLTSGGLENMVASSSSVTTRVFFNINVGKLSVGAINFARGPVSLYTAGVSLGGKGVGLAIIKVPGKTLFRSISMKAGGQITAKALPAVLSKVFAFFGSLGPIVGTAVGAVVGWFVGKVLEKAWPWIKKNAHYLIGVVLGLGGLVIAGPLVGALVGLGSFGAVSIATGGTLGGIGTSIGRFFSSLGGMVFGSIAMPVLVTLLVFPVIVALILFIINSGAYVVPPASEVFGGVSSPYIEIIKTPEPGGPFTNNELPKTITYNITIIAKKGVLTNVGIKYDCQVTSSSSKNCPSISDTPTSVDSISPSLPYTFSYTSTYDSSYKDSAVVDTISVTADVTEKSGVTAETSASVTFGNPPITCPLPAGKPVNSMNYSYNPQTDTGHGSTTYWNAMGGIPYRYSIPQWTGCKTPDSCPYYGYAYDVFPNGVKTVYAPTVLGKSTTWNLSATFSNGAAGYTVMYTDSTGSNTIVLTHVASTNAPKTATSGTKVATLFNQGTNTHLHLEFQTNGRWVKPENYFCK